MKTQGQTPRIMPDSEITISRRYVGLLFSLLRKELYTKLSLKSEEKPISILHL